ncbi:FAD-dependent oxidoreductase [Verrucomicrobium sp. BvORR106]|uniref:FAD-dependent oxidoreductase n=1 Tax=Verrucomicrobium sp. BvORR106 TaxID=1403819 RepID=UPI0006904D57|nr:FAD-dependent oxidoreductase [Verrucomicrobium sp. BvORR106]
MIRRTLLKLLPGIAATLLGGSLLQAAELRLPALFSDHMVLQSGQSAPVWGWATPGEDVTVAVAGQTQTTKTGADGKWKLALTPLEASSNPQSLTVKGSNSPAVTIQDVLVGEVWLGSGQSNMAMMVQGAKDAAAEKAAANFPSIRVFTEGSRGANTPQEEAKGSWVVCSPEAVGRFTAPGYFFARQLHQVLGRPVGVINSSVGGTPIEAWTRKEAQLSDPALKDFVAGVEQIKTHYNAAEESERYQKVLADYEVKVKAAKEAGKSIPRKPRDPAETLNRSTNLGYLFNGKIAPLAPYAIKGILWYQGEANAQPGKARYYEAQLALLINDWRKTWGSDLPFGFVQLPNIKRNDAWVDIREAYTRNLKLPKTGMAVTIDIGEALDVHPKNKQDVGKRLALWALHDVYEQKLVAQGPALEKAEPRDGNLVLTFKNTADGLATSPDGKAEGALTGFLVAGEDRNFKPATARLENGHVIISNPEIPQPVAVRYAWKDWPQANLYNSAGLPAGPFRSDDWPKPPPAEVRLAALFSEHAVVQAGAAVPIWGWAEPSTPITVTLAGQTKATRTTADGKWRVVFGRLTASPVPQTLEVKSPTKTLSVKDVLVGEVWLASGQSNMAYLFSRGQYPPAEAAAANRPTLRVFTVAKQSSREPEAECEGSWVVCTPETVGNFSAVAYFFARDLMDKLQVPVGMINSSWGGTDIAAWTSEDAQKKVPELKAQLERWKTEDAAFKPDEAKASYEKALATWKTRVQQAKTAGNPPPRKPQEPTQPSTDQNHPANLYNGMIYPLLPYGIRGVIWYQGEHNTATEEKARLYDKQLPLLIEDWRARWGRELPFAWVQLPNFERKDYRPLVREAMLKTLSVRNTGMAVTVDVGEANDNHPRNKSAVGNRLALWALDRVYREKLLSYSGPLPAEHKIEGDKVTVTFNHADRGLIAKDGPLKDFLIAGADRQWKPATASIAGRTVVVSNPEVPQPAAVRYAWASNPTGNLVNGVGLPASPFRTDDWKDPAPAAPAADEVEKTDLFVGGENGISLYRIPGIVVTPKGTVLAYCEARRTSAADWGEIEVHLRRSTDGGKTFSPAQHIAHQGARDEGNPHKKEGGEKEQTVNNPVAIVDAKTGTVHFLYCLNYKRCFYMRSEDDGLTFSAPVEITAAFEGFRPKCDWKVLATGPGHGIQLRNGRLLVPVWLAYGKEGDHGPSVTGTIYSDDQGVTWKSGDIALPNEGDFKNPNETAAVQLSDGRVMLNARSTSLKSRRLVTTSADGATGWSTPKFEESLWEPICMGSIIAFPKKPGALVFSNPHSLKLDERAQEVPGGRGDRVNVSLKLSLDDGKTWKVGRTIEPGRSAYSDLAVLPDGTGLCFYERDKRLTLAKFTLDWIAKGDKAVKPAVTQLPTIDLSTDTTRQVVIAQGTPEIYQGHPTTTLLPDGKTMYAVWTYGHGGGCGPMKRSDDGGKTWSEILPVPENWKEVRNCPSLYRLTDPQGNTRLFVFAGQGPDKNMQQSFSTDEGKTWTPMASNGLLTVMPFCTIVPVEGGKKLIGLSNTRRPGETQDKTSNIITQSESTDGGLTWTPWRTLLDLGPLKPCEPAVVRSPDGKQLLCLMRENVKHISLYMTSEDEGRTWSAPKPTPPGLNGDRHMIRTLPDGRMVVCFRDTGPGSATRTHFVAWVGRYEDITSGKDGQYRIKLLHSYKGGDCGYPGVELLPDGTVVATTYVKYREGPEQNSVVSVRFKLDETDKMPKTTAEAPANRKAAGILLDDGEAEYTGMWKVGEKLTPLVGSSYRLDDRGKKELATAKFTPSIPEAGRYELRLLYVPASNRASNATITIRGVEGEKTVALNQREACLEDGIPRPLGTFSFAKGKAGTIEISNANADGFVIVDALQLVLEPEAAAERNTRSSASFPMESSSQTVPVKIPPPMLLESAAKPSDVNEKSYDLVVIGGTPGGIACAVRAAREGLNVLLVNHTQHLGGFVTSGAGGWEAPYDGQRAPLYAEMLEGAADYYRKTYGEGSPQHVASMPSKTSRAHIDRPKVEPRIAEMLFNKMVGREKSLTVLLGHVVTKAERDGALIKSVTLKPMHGDNTVTVIGKVFADGMYEGDLMAAAGVKTQIGRESRAQYGEKHAGVIYTQERHKEPGQRGFPKAADEGTLNIRYNSHATADILEGPQSGAADGSVMSYNYRLVLTRDPANKIMVEKPANYDASIARAAGGGGFVPNLPNGKVAWNGGRLIGPQNDYPAADWPKREEISRRYLEGMLMRLWWIQNDPEAPEKERKQFAGYGLAADEFPDNNHAPYEIYVREARRLVGRYVFKEQDNVVAEGIARTPVHADSIAITDWPVDSVACLPHRIPGGNTDGILFLGEESRPAQVPYRSILSREVENLLVPVAISASHVGWGSIRLEPVWMQLGESAGFAAALAVKGQTTPGQLDSEAVIRKLAANRVMISFFNDVEVTADHPAIAAAQYFGTKGFFADYHARLDEPLTEAVRQVWDNGMVALRAGKLQPMELAKRVRDAESQASPEVGATRGAALQKWFTTLP